MSTKGEETKKMIIEKACSLFAKKGFKSVTMKDICIETGLSRGGLYRHYYSTQQIFSEIIDNLMNAQDNEFSEKMEKGYSAIQILNDVLERYRTEMLDNVGSLGLAIYEFYSEIKIDSKDNVLLKQYEHSVNTWKNFLSYGIERGEFKNVDSDELIDIIIFSYQGVRMLSEILPIDEKVSERIVNHIKKILLG
ncbi:MAG: TetR/AcrR family transcriptional regulator [Enterocloster citroniae]|nr:TetR/AcrR family transcriptional regulator [Enterocloster citroniae]